MRWLLLLLLAGAASFAYWTWQRPRGLDRALELELLGQGIADHLARSTGRELGVPPSLVLLRRTVAIDEATAEIAAELAEERWGETGRPAAAAFRAANAEPIELDAVATGLAQRLADDAEIQGIMTKDGWGGFVRAYPGFGFLVGASRPGVDAGGTRAILFVGIQAGNSQGTGDILLLERAAAARTWSVVARRTLWSR